MIPAVLEKTASDAADIIGRFEESRNSSMADREPFICPRCKNKKVFPDDVLRPKKEDPERKPFLIHGLTQCDNCAHAGIYERYKLQRQASQKLGSERVIETVLKRVVVAKAQNIARFADDSKGMPF